MYFEPFMFNEGGVTCRDGGLRENNPVQVAVRQAKKIWENKKPFDLILSVGSGEARFSSRGPTSTVGVVPSWLQQLFYTFLATMNGTDAWRRYYDNADGLTRRSRRLNVRLSSQVEPDLDDKEAVPGMIEDAKDFSFFNSHKYPLCSPPQSDLLIEVALQLRASLFFFQPKDISYLPDGKVATVTGFISSRLDSASKAFENLLALTDGFLLPSLLTEESPALENCKPVFRLEVSFDCDTEYPDKRVQLQVKFKDLGCSVAISGFPTTFKVSDLSFSPI
jgi:hypothetical protein